MKTKLWHYLLVATVLFAGSSTVSAQGLELANGVTAYTGGGGYAQPTVYTSGDIVILSGLVTLGSTADIGTLPANLRPRGRMVFTVWSGTSYARVDVQTNGLITVVGRRSSWISLNGITFSIR
jgi:hypothetical protein